MARELLGFYGEREGRICAGFGGGAWAARLRQDCNGGMLRCAQHDRRAGGRPQRGAPTNYSAATAGG
jgi:hypothetical protein